MKTWATGLGMFALLSTVFSSTLRASAKETAAAKAAPRDEAAGRTSEDTTKQLPGGALLHLSPGARIEIGPSTKLQLGPAGSPLTGTQVIKLISGRVDIEITPSKVPKTAVLIQGPHKVSAVAKGGRSIAIVDANRVTIAAVDGDMLAAAGSAWKPLGSGRIRGFVGSDPSFVDTRVPSAPSLRIARPLLLGLGDHPPDAQAEVSGVKEADHYRLSIWRVTDKGKELVRHLDTPGRATVAGLPAGRYQLTARAVDAAGIFGSESEASSLRIVGAELPPGSRREEGAIFLGQRTRAKLIGAEGLEASYNAAQQFMTAPESVGLMRGESTLLRLREPGTVEELKISLEPRTLHADVQITPKRARWPQDMLEVNVQLFDSRGRPALETTKVKPLVLVNVQPLDVTWLRSDNIMHAFIPAPPGAGPWVVRVEIMDEFGDPVARDFIEVAGPEGDGVVSAR